MTSSEHNSANEEILVHVCCGPCMLGVYDSLCGEKEVYGFFYNPNIHPWEEYQKRLMTAGFTASQLDYKLFTDDEYDVKKWMDSAVSFEDRCSGCIVQRLRRTAEVAREKGIPLFTTTLLISPYQKHDEIKQAGFKIADEEGIEFYYSDFRENYKESIKKSKEMHLYRQKYCGCLFSNAEKYA